MSRKNPASAFFVPIDGALFNDLGEGKVTPNMWCVYSMILRQVNFETGIWHGSAYRICDGWAWQIPQRTAQDSLKKLCAAGYLKSFHLHGSRNDYAVAVHGYPVRFGKWKGHRLNAAATTDPFSPVYEECGQEEITVSAQDQRNVSAASPQAPRSVTAASAQDQRNVSAASAYPNARNTPDVPDYPDVPHVQDGPERPDAPTVPAVKAKSTEGSDGWLARRVAAILKTKTEKLVIPTSAELHGLSDLSEKYGDLAALLAFYHFADRDRGLDGLDYPISAFLRDAPQYVEDVRQGIQAGEGDGYEHSSDAVPKTISALLGRPCAADDQNVLGEFVLPLCHLAYVESELQGVFEYDFACVRDYANTHSSDRLRTELAFFTLAAAQVA